VDSTEIPEVLLLFSSSFLSELLQASAEKSTEEIIQLFKKLLRGTQIHNSQQGAKELIIKMYHYKSARKSVLGPSEMRGYLFSGNPFLSAPCAHLRHSDKSGDNFTGVHYK
jgi:hypothetical protein